MVGDGEREDHGVSIIVNRGPSGIKNIVLECRVLS